MEEQKLNKKAKHLLPQFCSLGLCRASLGGKEMGEAGMRCVCVCVCVPEREAGRQWGGARGGEDGWSAVAGKRRKTSAEQKTFRIN